MSKARLIALAALASGAAVVAGSLPAQAHDSCDAVHGLDVACVYDAHVHIRACDGETDGHQVRAHWRNASGDISAGTFDQNGSDPGCAINVLPSSAVDFRVCEEVAGCSGWKPR